MATRITFSTEVREALDTEPIMVQIFAAGLTITLADDVQAAGYVTAGSAVEDPE